MEYTRRAPTGKHGVEVGAAGGQHHFVGLDLLVGYMQHDVTEQATLPHPVHGHKGVVVVAFGVVRDAVAIAIQQLHTSLHHGAALRGLLLPEPQSPQLYIRHSSSLSSDRALFTLHSLSVWISLNVKNSQLADHSFFTQMV